MTIVNVVSVVGLIIASFLAYGWAYMGTAGPSHFPFFVTYIVLISYAISYILSLWNVTGSMAKLIGLLSAAFILLISIIFTAMVLLGKGTYPSVFSFPACYINAILSVVLVFLWNRKK